MAPSLDDAIAAEEAAPQSAEEERFGQEALQSLPEQQRQLFASNPPDVLCVVRGFAKSLHRKEETLKAIQSISDWRMKVKFYHIFEEPMPNLKDFHSWWKEGIYGNDKYGHMLQCVRMEDIDVDMIEKMDHFELERVQGQKMKAYGVYKEDQARKTGVLRYKHTLLIDLTHIKMSMVSTSGKRDTLKRIFAIGSKYYPETMWKIYLVNSPMTFRAIYACVKPFLEAETIGKINILGSTKDAIKKLEADGVPLSQLPDWMGGGHKGIPTYDYVQSLMQQRRPHTGLGAPQPPSSPQMAAQQQQQQFGRIA